MRQNLVLVLQFHAKHGVRKGFDHRRHHFDSVFFTASLARLLLFRFRPSSHALLSKLRLLQSLENVYQHAPVASRGRVNIHGPFAVTATVCSKWAESLPSAVTAVQSSLRIFTAGPPTFTIGSIARTIPSCSRGPCPGLP